MSGDQIVDFRKLVQIPVNGAVQFAHGAGLIPWLEIELVQVIDVEQFAGFGGGKISAAGAEELQRVPIRGVVAGADGDAARRVQTPYGVLDDGRRNQSQIHHIVSGGLQRREHAFTHHNALDRGSRADHHRRARFQKSAERGSEVDDMRGGHAATHHAA